MRKKIFVLVLLAFAVSTLHAQVDVMGGEGNGGPRLTLSGELMGMFTLGFADEDQLVVPTAGTNPAGVFTRAGYADGERNGFMTRMDFGIRFVPVSWIDLYVQFRTRSRPGNPYIPLMLEAASADDFDLSFEHAWGRINLIDALRFDAPLDLYLRAGLFDTAPASFQRVTRLGTENVMNRIRTKNIQALQLEGVFQVPFAESVSVMAATPMRINESIRMLFDVDGDQARHGQVVGDEFDRQHDISLFAAAQVRGVNTPLGPVFVEAVYGLNAENIFSGHNFGVNCRWDMNVTDGVVVPLGLGLALLEKNIDPMARAGHGLGNVNGIFNNDSAYPISSIHNLSTVSFRRSLRLGVGAGLRMYILPELGLEANVGFSYSQIAHIYRDTITLNSASFDMRLTFDNRFFVGGGIFMGTLTEVEWRTSADADVNFERDFLQMFRPVENMGFEVHAGLSLGGGSRLVFGYNMNRGLSMNHGIESMSDAQMIFRQRGSAVADDLFETGGFFTKLVISW